MVKRATIAVVKNQRVLLVKEKNEARWSFPSEEMQAGESVIEAAIRELNEELGLDVDRVTRLNKCDYSNDLNEHNACFVQTNREPELKKPDSISFTWWDMKEELPVYEHVTKILNCIKSPGVIYG